MLCLDVLTLFPELVRTVLGESMLGIAARKRCVTYRVTDIRDFSTDRHRSVDDRPYGGGPGMVLMCPPVFAAYEAVLASGELPVGEAPPEPVVPVAEARPAPPDSPRTLILTPSGRRFDQALARELAEESWLVLICGHYEGFDARIIQGLGRIGPDGAPLSPPDRVEPLSLGDFVLTGGELAALTVVDAVVRLVPGVLGDDQSAAEESFGCSGLLDYPQYTRPPEYRGLSVPEVLRSGHHERIRRWRAEQAHARTRASRPDLVGPPRESAGELDRA